MFDLEGLIVICLIFGTPLVAVLGVIFLVALKILRGNPSKTSQKLQADEAKLIQQIHQGLTKMEERVEALETILLERGRHEAHREPD